MSLEEDIKYSVAILGLGEIGQSAFIDLTEIPCIETFFLVSRAPKKLEGVYESYIKEKDINRVAITYKDLPSCVGDIDLAIVCVDASDYKNKIKNNKIQSRLEILYDNIGPIKTVAQSLRGFEGHTIIVTNPVDIMSYLFAYYSDIDPSLITGLNHTDTMRLTRIIRDKLLPGKVKDADLAKVEAYALGPHTKGYVVPIFKSFGGRPASDLRWYNEENFSRVRKRLDEYGFKQIVYGNIVENTVQPIRDVVKAIINQEDNVTASVFIEPKYLDFIRPELLGLFVGYPVKFKGFSAIPRLDDFTIDSQFDQIDFVKGYNYLESIINKLEKEKIIEGRVERIFAIDTAFEVKEKKKPLIIVPNYPAYDLELRVLGASGYRVLEWSPNNPNNPELLFESPDRHTISSMLFKELNGEKLLFVGTRNAIYVLDYDSKEFKKRFEPIRDSRIRSIDAILEDGLLVLGASREGLFLWKDHEKPVQQFAPNERLKDVKVAKIDSDYNIFTAGENIYQLNLDGLELLMTYSDDLARDSFTNLLISDRNLFASHHDIIRLNINRPNRILTRYRGSVYQIKSFEKARIDGLSCLIAGSDGPSVMRWLEDFPERKELTYRKESPNGTSKVRVMKSGVNYFILGAESTFDRVTNPARINIWESNMPKEPRTLLTGADYSIKAMEVIKI